MTNACCLQISEEAKGTVCLIDLANTWVQISGMCSEINMSNIARKKKIVFSNPRCILTTGEKRPQYS